jgi:ABC-2 type transport system ATP-binding protein
MTFAIDTERLRKQFGDKVAVRGIDLQVRQGEAFGFLGPNGAGKTTFIKMLLGLTRPTSGVARLLGQPITNKEARRKIGFLPEHFRFHDWLTASEFLTVHGRLCGLSPVEITERAPKLLDRVGLSAFATKQLRTFSKGMLQRVGLAQALLNAPALVFLDEPTSGLDPVGRLLVRDMIRELRENGATVFLNSHLLSEVEITCDRIAFIKHGEVVQSGELKALTAGQTNVTIQATGATTEILESLKRWATDVRAEDGQIHIILSKDSELPQVVRFLVEKGVDIYAVTPERVSLEQLFVQVVGSDGGL